MEETSELWRGSRLGSRAGNVRMGLGHLVLSASKEALKAQSRQKFAEAPEERACALQKCQGYKGQRTEEPFQIKGDKRTKCNA